MALHFLVVTPWMLLVGWLSPRSVESPARMRPDVDTRRDSSAILAVFCVTRSLHAAHYLYFVLITTIVANSPCDCNTSMRFTAP